MQGFYLAAKVRKSLGIIPQTLGFSHLLRMFMFSESLSIPDREERACGLSAFPLAPIPPQAHWTEHALRAFAFLTAQSLQADFQYHHVGVFVPAC